MCVRLNWQLDVPDCLLMWQVLNFLDMGGHEKYLKTTLYGFTCMLPGKLQRCALDWDDADDGPVLSCSSS
jgi:GTPase